MRIPMIVDMYRDGRFKLDEMVSQVYDLPDWERAIHDLESGALARGVIQAARGEAAAAAATLQKVLDEAPPGFAGWWLPVDPMLRQAIEGEQLRRVMATVAERAS